MTFEDYKHHTRIQVRFKDIDKQGHVNNANHLTYFETERIEYFKDVIPERHDWVRMGLILAKTEIEYKRPILLDDEVYCFSRVARFGNKSFDVHHALVRKTATGLELLAKGVCVIVGMNYETNETVAIPESWKEAVRIYEDRAL